MNISTAGVLPAISSEAPKFAMISYVSISPGNLVMNLQQFFLTTGGENAFL